jgi:hypothetical protein
MKLVEVPVLAVVGSKDGSLARAKDLQAVLPTVKLVVIDGATHDGTTGVLSPGIHHSDSGILGRPPRRVLIERNGAAHNSLGAAPSPTPAFSGLLTELAKWFRISGCC